MQLHPTDRLSLAEAMDLISAYGEEAPAEAAARADHSRVQGNVVHFCRWRRIERAIEMLGVETAPGLLH